MKQGSTSKALDIINELNDAKKPLHRVYFLLMEGNDYLKKQIENKIKEKALEETFEAFDTITINGDTFSLNDFELAISCPPFGKKKVIILSNAQEAPKQVLKKAIATKVPDFAVLIVIANSESLPLTPEKDTMIVDDYSITDKMMEDWIVVKVKSEGHEISKEAISEIISRLDGDFQVTELEIKKLSLFVGKRVKIEKKDVENVVENVPVQDIYVLIDSMLTKNREEALKLYEKMTHSSKPTPENVILSQAMKNLSQMLFIKDFVIKGTKNSEEISIYLQKIHKQNLPKYIVSKIAKSIEKYSFEELFDKFKSLEDIDIKTKKGEIELPFAIKLFIESA